MDETTFKREVLERSRELPVVVDFWAEWCSPCRLLTPLLDRLAEEYAGRFALVKINIDDSPWFAAQLQISSLPTVLAFVDGEVRGHFVGAVSEAQARSFLEQLLPTEADRLFKQAAALHARQPAQALELYEKVLALEPRHSDAAAALAELAFQAGDYERARKLAESVHEGDAGWRRASTVRDRLQFRELSQSAGSLPECLERARNRPDDLAALLDLGIAQAAAGAWRDALEALVQVVERDRRFRDELPKQLMVKIFGIVGAQSELANEYRSRLSRALY